MQCVAMVKMVCGIVSFNCTGGIEKTAECIRQSEAYFNRAAYRLGICVSGEVLRNVAHDMNEIKCQMLWYGQSHTYGSGMLKEVDIEENIISIRYSAHLLTYYWETYEDVSHRAFVGNNSVSSFWKDLEDIVLCSQISRKRKVENSAWCGLVEELLCVMELFDTVRIVWT